MVPGVMLGLAAGVTGGIWAASELDTTPYAETDLNTASRNARQAGSAAGLQEAQRVAARTTSRLRASNAQRVGQLEQRVADWRTAYQEAKKDNGEQQARLVRLQGSLAETTASLDNATSASEAGGAVEGTLKVTAVLRSADKPWPADCAEPLDTYQVRVTAGAGATVATARLVDAEVTTRKAQKDVLTLTCSLTYAADLPTPLGAGYQFIAVETDQPDAALDTKNASDSALGSGNAPVLSISDSSTAR